MLFRLAGFRVSRLRLADQVHDNRRREPESSKREPGKNDREDLVEQLEVEEEHANQVVTRLVHPRKVHQCVDCSSKRAVEPSSTLTDKLGRAFGHIRFAFGSFDVGQVPFGAGFGDQFKAKDTILGQEHVLFEDVHAFNTLFTELLGKRVVTVEILLQRAAHDSAESVGRECTGQHTDVPKRRLEGLIENVANLVLEVLSGNQGIEQVASASTQHGVDFTASTSEVFVIVKSLPEVQ